MPWPDTYVNGLNARLHRVLRRAACYRKQKQLLGTAVHKYAQDAVYWALKHSESQEELYDLEFKVDTLLGSQRNLLETIGKLQSELEADFIDLRTKTEGSMHSQRSLLENIGELQADIAKYDDRTSEALRLTQEAYYNLVGGNDDDEPIPLP